MIRVLTFHDDMKQHEWAAHSDGQLEFVRLSRMGMLLVLLNPWKRRRYSGVLFRYLNDKKTAFKTCRHAVMEGLIALVARIAGKRVIWLAHNIDRESKLLHPRANAFRRMIVQRLCDAILVTEDHLVPHARRLLAAGKSKPIGVCTFGVPTSSEGLRSAYGTKIVADLPVIREHASYGVSVGHWLPKKRKEIELVLKLAAMSEGEGQDVGFIVGGPQVAAIKKDAGDLYEKLESAPNIQLVDQWLDIAVLKKKGLCDFVIKDYDDYSMPFGLLQTCDMGIPVVTSGEGFGGELVGLYELGAILPTHPITISSLVNQLRQVSRSGTYGTAFLEANTWRRGALALLSAFVPPTGSKREKI